MTLNFLEVFSFSMKDRLWLRRGFPSFLETWLFTEKLLLKGLSAHLLSNSWWIKSDVDHQDREDRRSFLNSSWNDK